MTNDPLDSGEPLLSFFDMLDEIQYVRTFEEPTGFRVHVLSGDVMLVYRVHARGWALIDRVFESDLLLDREPMNVFDDLAESWHEAEPTHDESEVLQ